MTLFITSDNLFYAQDVVDFIWCFIAMPLITRTSGNGIIEELCRGN